MGKSAAFELSVATHAYWDRGKLHFAVRNSDSGKGYVSGGTFKLSELSEQDRKTALAIKPKETT